MLRGADSVKCYGKVLIGLRVQRLPVHACECILCRRQQRIFDLTLKVSLLTFTSKINNRSRKNFFQQFSHFLLSFHRTRKRHWCFRRSRENPTWQGLSGKLLWTFRENFCLTFSSSNGTRTKKMRKTNSLKSRDRLCNIVTGFQPSPTLTEYANDPT